MRNSGCAGNALEALAVVERENVRQAVGGDRVARTVGERHLDQRAAIALHEDIRERSVTIDFLCVHHGVATGEGAELARRDRCELPGAQRGVAQTKSARGRVR